MVEIGHHRCYSLHTQSSKVRTGLRLCSFSTMPKLVVYKGYSGHVRQNMCYFFTYTIIGVSVGPGHMLNPDHAYTGCVQRILYRSRWASRVLFITYTIIEGLVRPAPVHNLDHAFTGCVQKDIVSVRLGITGVIHYIYNHCGSGRACASAQFPPGHHWLNTIYSIGLLRH